MRLRSIAIWPQRCARAWPPSRTGRCVKPTRLLDVGAGAFRPAPKVNSSVVRLQVIDTPPEWARVPLYGEVVTAAFGQRRKTLRNALRQYLPAEAIHALGIDPGARAETLAPV